MDEPDKRERLARFWKKLLRLTRGRIDILNALKITAEEEKDAAFRKIVRNIHESIEQGVSLSEALGDYPSEFSLSVREMIRSAEKSGAWDEITLEIIAGLEEGTFD